MNGLDDLNTRSAADAEALLLGVCASPAWARAVVAGRPYPDADTARASARAAWRSLSPDEWRSAFAGHPRIGERGGPSQEQSDREQSGLAAMDSSTAAAIARGNQAYESRFGYVFLIRAAGRGPEEILEQLERRLQHDPVVEIGVAAEQQAEITDLRLADVLA